MFTVSLHGGADRPFQSATYRIDENGVLIVTDEESGKRFTYSPSYWACVTEDKPHPRSRPQVQVL